MLSEALSSIGVRLEDIRREAADAFDTRSRCDPLRHPLSSLALGDWGWTQIANSTVAGLLTLAFSAGLRSAFLLPEAPTWGPLSVGYGR